MNIYDSIREGIANDFRKAKLYDSLMEKISKEVSVYSEAPLHESIVNIRKIIKDHPINT